MVREIVATAAVVRELVANYSSNSAILRFERSAPAIQSHREKILLFVSHKILENNDFCKSQQPKSPRALEPHSPRALEPKSPRAPEPKSPTSGWPEKTLSDNSLHRASL